ncbi:RNA-binding cell elongation regulator Jag/EloR [Anaerobacillus isosaccharinicus]|uniref:RNA-binding protein KhpB n=1 Tax=Anaerobacillus isosaccharinicus TaxID=1532552 RepID=A0A1S2MFW6_9BACI|nr:RNA-binding cell elongation regulator Jag/EloR [Anaerobacillus isosaccharinicus]MBA5584213.1 protein jag [Anaerobacillus isosaccharinicus]QOY37385.1 protein jag [Anaerobacillus isosaccharinicus]
MKKITVSGKTVDEAVQSAIKQLNTTRERVSIKIVEEPQKGFLGLIGVKPAVVEVEIKPDAADEAINFLQDVTKNMGVSIEINKVETKDGLLLNLSGEGIGMLIGKRGQTLDSLQYLVNLVANRSSEQYMRIVLDAENYRDRRKESLEQLAKRLGTKAVRTRKEVILEPMNALERKIIHTALQEIKGVKTYSEGVEPNRRIVVAPASK